MTQPTPEQRIARLMLARLAHRGQCTPSELQGGGVPRTETKAFAASFSLLTKGGPARYVGDRGGPGRRRVPVFAATNDGHALARHLPPEVS